MLRASQAVTVGTRATAKQSFSVRHPNLGGWTFAWIWNYKDLAIALRSQSRPIDAIGPWRKGMPGPRSDPRSLFAVLHLTSAARETAFRERSDLFKASQKGWLRAERTARRGLDHRCLQFGVTWEAHQPREAV